MLIIAYYRVSTARQGQSGLGLDAQREQVHRYTRETGATLVAEHIEIESGAKSSRPVLAEAMQQCRRRKATLVIAKIDRLARNVAFVSNLLESNVEFVACDAPHANRMMLQILSVFAEHEARAISERTRAALAAAKARGVRLGVHGRSLAIQHKHDALAFAKTLIVPIEKLRTEGARTLKDIAEGLNDAGYRTRDGQAWYPMSVSRVLARIPI